MDYPAAARPPLLGVYVDEEEAAAAAATATSPVSAAASAAAELARVAAGKLLRQWGPREWLDPRARRKLVLPGAGGIVVCSDKLLLRCSTVTGVCCSRKHLPAAACCCCFASHTSKGPLLVVGCVDGAVRVFVGRTLRLLITLETTAVPVSANTAVCLSYGCPDAAATKLKKPHYCASSSAAATLESEPRGTPLMPTRGTVMEGAATGTSPLSISAAANGCRLQQTPTCLLLVGNNALLAGLGGGIAAAFFLENRRLAAVYQLPPSVRCFLQQQLLQQTQLTLLTEHAAALQQLQLQQCREQAARKWRGEPAKLQPLQDRSGSNRVNQVQLSLEAQFPVCCLYAAVAERLVVMAVHPEGWRDTPLLSSSNNGSTNGSGSTLQRWWRSSKHAMYHRAHPPAAAATSSASDLWGSCGSGNSGAAEAHQARAVAGATVTEINGGGAADTATAATAASCPDFLASWPLLVFQQHTGACIGTLWGCTSRTLAVGLGKLPIWPHKWEQQQNQQQRQQQQQQQQQKRQQLCCLAVTTSHIHFWQQQGPARSNRRLHQIRSTQQPRSQQQQQPDGAPSSCVTADAARLTDPTTSGAAAAGAAVADSAAADAGTIDSVAADAAGADATIQLEKQQLLHEKRKDDATVCPSLLCGCRASRCQLAAAAAATVAEATAAAARQPVTGKPQAAAEGGSLTAAAAAQAGTAEGGCVAGVWWSLRASFSLPALLSQQQEQQQQENCSLADAVLDWESRLMAVLPNRSFSCCLLTWRFGDGGFELVPFRWVQVAATGRSPQKPLLQRLWYNRGLLAASATDGYVRLLFRADLSTQEQQQEGVP
ncbi:uncharacterized protein EMH_0006950 [Eimeria mitis]|uniref:Uncharacterized protein n=1 Tax=Eimeria mitis TaxID=44415 RepID=U6K4D9_9EIME|nr:uncharacterized protein EMH_0006950 [Eimeria mitis]CDJ30623.1 hypothetical protein, conserved [Eimeria mitis]